MRADDGWLDRQFARSERLGIDLPCLENEWEELPLDRQAAILDRWETIRGRIPDRIFSLEETIREKQKQLFEEEDFVRSCRINGDIAELASRINDLHIWFRTRQELDEAKAHIG